MPKFGSGEVQFQGCILDDGATAIAFCHHKRLHVPNKLAIQHYLVEQHVDREQDFSLVLDGQGEMDTILVFGNQKTLSAFRLLVTELAEMNR